METVNNNSQRAKNYRAVVPFFILYDLDLNANHLRFYGQIEQMESNPNPNIHPTFSYAWMAKQLNINKRNTMKVAQKLVEKGYLVHEVVDLKKGIYIWRTVKKDVVVSRRCEPDDWDEEVEGDVFEEHGGNVTKRHGGDVKKEHPKVLKNKILKNKTITPIVPFAEKSQELDISEMLEDNPHGISEDEILEWRENRILKDKKNIITRRVWKRLNGKLSELKEIGVDLRDALDRMLAQKWLSLEVEYFNQKIKSNNSCENHYITAEEARNM